jgi:DNA-binding FadR family transcriptional regulator
VEKAIIPPEKKPYQEIGDDLRAQIAQGRYPVGSRLPPERHIAETYGVSRTIVREALLMLELQGTVDIRQGSGVYVMRIPTKTTAKKSSCSAATSVRLKFSRRASCWRAISPPLPRKWPPAPISTI